MGKAKEVTIAVSTALEVVEIVETIYGKLRDWLAPDLSIDCPHCGESQTYDLGTLKKGWFSTHFRCDDCNKKIKIEIEVEVTKA